MGCLHYNKQHLKLPSQFHAEQPTSLGDPQTTPETAPSTPEPSHQAVTKLSGEPEYERHRIAFSPRQQAA